MVFFKLRYPQPNSLRDIQLGLWLITPVVFLWVVPVPVQGFIFWTETLKGIRHACKVVIIAKSCITTHTADEVRTIQQPEHGSSIHRKDA